MAGENVTARRVEQRAQNIIRISTASQSAKKQRMTHAEEGDGQRKRERGENEGGRTVGHRQEYDVDVGGGNGEREREERPREAGIHTKRRVNAVGSATLRRPREATAFN